MKILTVENEAYEVNELPNEIADLRYCVLDNSDPKEPDFFFLPLVFLESFNDPALVLRIGPHVIKMPYNWRIIVGDPEAGELEVLPLTKINDRGFKIFTFNPIKSFRPAFLDIEIEDVYKDVKWFFPKLRNGQLLCVPLHGGPNPTCAYFVKDISRASEQVDIYKLL